MRMITRRFAFYVVTAVVAITINFFIPRLMPGNPALAVPVPLSGANVSFTSLQLIGPGLAEADLLNAGRLIESAVNR